MGKAKRTRARYTQEFKLEALRLIRGGQSFVATAQVLGVSDQTLHNWLKADREGKLSGTGAKPVSAEQMEISAIASGAGASEDGARYLKKSDGVLRQGSQK